MAISCCGGGAAIVVLRSERSSGHRATSSLATSPLFESVSPPVDSLRQKFMKDQISVIDYELEMDSLLEARKKEITDWADIDPYTDRLAPTQAPTSVIGSDLAARIAGTQSVPLPKLGPVRTPYKPPPPPKPPEPASLTVQCINCGNYYPTGRLGYDTCPACGARGSKLWSFAYTHPVDQPALCPMCGHECSEKNDVLYGRHLQCTHCAWHRSLLS